MYVLMAREKLKAGRSLISVTTGQLDAIGPVSTSKLTSLVVRVGHSEQTIVLQSDSEVYGIDSELRSVVEICDSLAISRVGQTKLHSTHRFELSGVQKQVEPCQRLLPTLVEPIVPEARQDLGEHRQIIAVVRSVLL